MKSNKYTEAFTDVAKTISKMSTCQSRKVGCVLIKANRIIAIGYNGVPSGKIHCEDRVFKDRNEHHDWSCKNENHAEMNLICFCAREGMRTEDTILITTLAPCINCAKIILSCGIKEVYYLEEYDLDTEGIKFLLNNKIKCEIYE